LFNHRQNQIVGNNKKKKPLMELQTIVFIGEMPYLQEMPLALFNPQ
jgi:hypothetical protein